MGGASFLSPCEDAERSCQSEKLKPERGFSPEPFHASTVILNFSSSKTVRNKFLLFLDKFLDTQFMVFLCYRS